MNFKKFTIYAVITTAICLGYVYQQVSIVTLGYSLQRKEKQLSEVVDRSRVLLYNNTSLKAPQYLADMLKENEIDLRLPDTAAVEQIRIVKHKHDYIAKSVKSGWGSRLLDTVVPKAEAALYRQK